MATKYHELREAHASAQGAIRRSDFYADGGELAIDALSANASRLGLGSNYIAWATLRLGAESAWIDCGSPYYKIGGHYLEAAARARLDVPCDMMRLPFPAMLVRLQEGHGLILHDHGDEVGGELKTILAVETEDGLTIHAVFDSDDPEGTTMVFSMRLDEGGSLEDAIERGTARPHRDIEGGYMSGGAAVAMNRIARQCLKVLTTVALLAIGKSELLDPEVLSRDRASMKSASDEAKSRIVDRARRRGKTGWTVGETRLPRNSRANPAERSGGRELTRSHLRGGHFHAVRYGRGRTEIKVMWFPPTAVRPDLPATESRGYVAA